MKKFSFGLLTFICVVFLILDTTIFAFKLSVSKYIDTAKLVNIISDIDVADLLVDYNITEMSSIKDTLKKSGVPEKKVNKFLSSKPVNSYASNVAEQAINNTINNDDSKVVKKGEVYSFLDNNISTISEETKIFKTKKEQDEFLKSVKDKTPQIENNINKIVSRAQNKKGYINKLKIIFNIFDIFYKKVINIILLFMFIICVLGIIVSRESFYKSFKWIGLSFLISAGICICLSILGLKADINLEYIPELFKNNIKDIIKDICNSIYKYGIIYAVIGAALVNINIIYYLGLEKK